MFLMFLFFLPHSIHCLSFVSTENCHIKTVSYHGSLRYQIKNVNVYANAFQMIQFYRRLH